MNLSSSTPLPREKARLFGLANLSDAELVSLVLGSGRAGKPITALAAEVLQKVPLATWSNLSAAELSQISGCGPVKTWQLAACAELGRRIFVPAKPPVINCTRDVQLQVLDLARKQREEVVCLYLNARQELIKKQLVAIGGLQHAQLHPRDVFAPALQLPAAAVILVHNHPSGNPEPSQNDLQVTKNLLAAGQLLGVNLLDHVIIGRDTYQSLAELGVIRM